MAGTARAQNEQLLRAICQRLSVTPTSRLPWVVPSISNRLTECEYIIRDSYQQHNLPQSGKQGNASAIVQSLLGQISSFLLETKPEAQYAAMVLIKTMIEIGGCNVLKISAPWVQNMIRAIKTSSISTTRITGIINVTRIFLLTQEHPSLIRDITTKSMPHFLTTCLSILDQPERFPRGHNDFLDTVLLSFCELMPYHPTLFRPHTDRIQKLLWSLVVPNYHGSPSDLTPPFIPQATRKYAQRMLVLFHYCAPKQSINEALNRTLNDILLSFHATTDLVFRSTSEVWLPHAGLVKAAGVSSNAKQVMVGDAAPKPLPLPPWSGIDSGIERCIALLHTLQTFLTSPTGGTVDVPLSLIYSTLERVMTVRATSVYDRGRDESEFGTAERDALAYSLPSLQLASLEVAQTLVHRFRQSLAPLAPYILADTLYVFESSSHSDIFRLATYQLVSDILPIIGEAALQANARGLRILLRECCTDMSGARPGNADDVTSGLDKQNGYLMLDNHETKVSSAHGTSYTAEDILGGANGVYCAAVRFLPRSIMDRNLKARMEEVAILSNNHEAILALTLHAGRGGQDAGSSPGLLSFAARLYPQNAELEAMLHPRMPVVQYRSPVKTDDVDELEVIDDEGTDSPISALSRGHSPPQSELPQAMDVDLELPAAESVPIIDPIVPAPSISAPSSGPTVWAEVIEPVPKSKELDTGREELDSDESSMPELEFGSDLASDSEGEEDAGADKATST